MTFDWTFHVAELLTLVTICGVIIKTAIKVMRAADRVSSVLKDFPPHRHVNNHIVYPEGYEPGAVGEMNR